VPSCVLSGYAVIWLLTEITDDFGGTREKMGFRLFCSHLISLIVFFSAGGTTICWSFSKEKRVNR